MEKLYTIGHSNHETGHFIALLKMHEIAAVCDVRSSPYSQYNPQYNRELLQKALRDSDTAYVYLGGDLGPRSENPACYVDGKVQYSRLARTESFLSGLNRLRAGMKTHRIALMCSEKDPISCHRMILICRQLRPEPVEIVHILEDGRMEGLRESEQRLIRELKISQLRLFERPENLVERAYDTQAERIAYVRDNGAGVMSDE